MNKLRNLFVSLMLTGLIVANIGELFVGAGTCHRQTTISVREASLWYPGFRLMKKQYDDEGNFIGCLGYGNDCVVIPLITNEVTVSTEGIHVQ